MGDHQRTKMEGIQSGDGSCYDEDDALKRRSTPAVSATPDDSTTRKRRHYETEEKEQYGGGEESIFASLSSSLSFVTPPPVAAAAVMPLSSPPRRLRSCGCDCINCDCDALSKWNSSKKRKTTSKKRVRFASTHAMTIIEYVPLCCEYSIAEKYERWLQPMEQDCIRMESMNDTAEVQLKEQHRQLQLLKNTNDTTLSFIETFTKVYTNAFDSTANQTSSSSSSVPLLMQQQQLKNCDTLNASTSPNTDDNTLTMLLGIIMYNDNSRGLEDRILPSIGIERRMIRRHLLQTIVNVYQLVNNRRKQNQQKQQQISKDHCQSNNSTTIRTDSIMSSSHRQDDIYNTIDQDDISAILCHLSQSLSLSARRFGEAMGIVDATSAMLEYNNKK